MKIITEGHDRRNWLLLGRRYFELVVQFHMTKDEFTQYDNVKNEIQITSDDLFGNTVLKESEFRGNGPINSYHDAYTRDRLNPIVKLIVKKSKNEGSIKFKCRTRKERDHLKLDLEVGGRWFKGILDTSNDNGTRAETTVV